MSTNRWQLAFLLIIMFLLGIIFGLSMANVIITIR